MKRVLILFLITSLSLTVIDAGSGILFDENDNLIVKNSKGMQYDEKGNIIGDPLSDPYSKTQIKEEVNCISFFETVKRDGKRELRDVIDHIGYINNPRGKTMLAMRIGYGVSILGSYNGNEFILFTFDKVSKTKNGLFYEVVGFGQGADMKEAIDMADGFSRSKNRKAIESGKRAGYLFSADVEIHSNEETRFIIYADERSENNKSERYTFVDFTVLGNL